MSRWVYLLPILGFAVLAFFLFKSLWAPAPSIIPSALINKSAPRLVLPGLDAQSPGFTPAEHGAWIRSSITEAFLKD